MYRPPYFIADVLQSCCSATLHEDYQVVHHVDQNRHDIISETVGALFIPMFHGGAEFFSFFDTILCT